MKEFEHIIEALLANAPIEEIVDFITEDSGLLEKKYELLTEANHADEHRETQNFYTLMFEQYLDEQHCYTYEGWDELLFLERPKVEKYWVKFQLVCPVTFDFEGGAKRLRGKNKENVVQSTTTNDGKKILKVNILRSLLDELEDENRRIARKEAEEQGLMPDQGQDEEQDDMGMDMGMEGGPF
jgi:hypothetical protein